jgi:hypothetical protein
MKSKDIIKKHTVHSCWYYRDKGISCINYHVKGIDCIGTKCGYYEKVKQKRWLDICTPVPKIN